MKDQKAKIIGEDEKDRNFFKIPWAIIDSGLLARIKPSEVKVYLALSRHADYKTGRAFPSIALICKLSGMNKNVVCRATERLEYFGVIEKYRAPKAFKYKNVYRVLRNPKINPLIIPRKVEKRTARRRAKDGKWEINAQDSKERLGLDTIPQNMERD